MLLHPIGNYVMQRALSRLHSEDVCTDAIDDVLPHLSQIMTKRQAEDERKSTNDLFWRFFGLLSPLITCAAHTGDDTQKQCIKALRVAVKCDEKSAVDVFVPNVLHLGVEGHDYSSSISQIRVNVVEQHAEMVRKGHESQSDICMHCSHGRAIMAPAH